MNAAELKVLKNSLAYGDESCVFTPVYNYYYNIKGELQRTSVEDIDDYDEETQEEFIKTIKQCFSGHMGKNLREHSVYHRVKENVIDNSVANILRTEYCYLDSYEDNKLVTKTTVTEDNKEVHGLDAYVDKLAQHLAIVGEGKSYIPANRGVKSYTIHVVGCKIANLYSPKKLAKLEEAKLDFINKYSCIITWVDTVSTIHAKTMVEQPDGSFKVVKVDSPVISARPIFSSIYPNVINNTVDERSFLFNSKVPQETFAKLVRNCFDCNVEATEKQTYERFDSMVEELFAGVVPFDLKASVYDDIINYKETSVLPKFDHTGFIAMLHRLGVDYKNSDAICDFFKEMYVAKELNMDAVTQHEHKIEVPSVNTSIHINSTSPFNDVVKTTVDENGYTWVCVKAPDGIVKLDGTYTCTIDSKKFIETINSMKQEESDIYGIQRVKTAYADFVKQNDKLLKVDFDAYSECIMKNNTHRQHKLQEMKTERNAEYNARFYVNGRYIDETDRELKQKEKSEYYKALSRNKAEKEREEKRECFEGYIKAITHDGREVAIPKDKYFPSLEPDEDLSNTGGDGAEKVYDKDDLIHY